MVSQPNKGLSRYDVCRRGCFTRNAMRNVLRQIGWVVTACSAMVGGANAQSESGAKFIRVVEEDDGGVVRLEIAIREYGPIAGEGPVVSLAGAVHIADAVFYERLQSYLDALDVVLFEGVKPPGAGEDPGRPLGGPEREH